MGEDRTYSMATNNIQGNALTLAGANLTSAMPTVSKQQALNAYNTAGNFAGNEQNYLNQTQGQLINESGIPQIQSSYGNLSQVFGMYLADKNLSQKYSSDALNSGTYDPVYNGDISASNTSYNSNPYLNQSPSQLVSNVAKIGPNTNASGNYGFTTPGAIISAMGEVPTAVNSLLNTLSNAYTGVSGNVQNVLNQAQGEYEQKSNALQQMANIITNAYATQQANNQTTGFNNVLTQVAGQLSSNNTPAQNVATLKKDKAQVIQSLINGGMSSSNANLYYSQLLSAAANGTLVGYKTPPAQPAPSIDAKGAKTWNIKTLGGQTLKLKSTTPPTGISWAIDSLFNRDALNPPSTTVDPQTQYTNLTSHSDPLTGKPYTEQQIIEYFQKEGFTVN